MRRTKLWLGLTASAALVGGATALAYGGYLLHPAIGWGVVGWYALTLGKALVEQLERRL